MLYVKLHQMNCSHLLEKVKYYEKLHYILAFLDVKNFAFKNFNNFY